MEGKVLLHFNGQLRKQSRGENSINEGRKGMVVCAGGGMCSDLACRHLACAKGGRDCAFAKRNQTFTMALRENTTAYSWHTSNITLFFVKKRSGDLKLLLGKPQR